MELNGALWNPLETSKSLSKLVGKVRELVRRQRPLTMPTALPPRAGEVKRAVIQVLELSAQPISLAEIRQRCEQLLGRPANDSTVKDCVHKLSRGPEALLVRVERGRYIGGPFVEARPAQRTFSL